MRSVLVAGATGALRPAVQELAARGEIVYALARPGPRLDALVAQTEGDVRPLAADWTEVEDMSRRIAEAVDGAVGRALLYCPTASSVALDRMAGFVGRQVVRVITSAAAAPVAGDGGTEPDPAWLAHGDEAVLLLGWARESDGPRWHTPEEISEAALEVLGDGRSRILGTVRPWADRPT